MTVLCVITEGGGRVGETDRLCFERFELCHSLKKKKTFIMLFKVSSTYWGKKICIYAIKLILLSCL